MRLWVFTEVSPDNMSPVSPSSLTVDDFQLLLVIGRGSFGKVLLVRGKRDKRVYALKILLKSYVMAKNQVEHTKSERKILEEMNCLLCKLIDKYIETQKRHFIF